MNGTEFLLDTNIVLYLLKGDQTLAQLLDTHVMYISFVTEMELLSFPGLSQVEEQEIQRFIAASYTIDFNHSIKQKAIQYRKKYRLKLPDAIIAATSNCSDPTLVSADQAMAQVKELTLLKYDPQG